MRTAEAVAAAEHAQALASSSREVTKTAGLVSAGVVATAALVHIYVYMYRWMDGWMERWIGR